MFAAAAPATGWALLDLRPLREYPYFRALSAVQPDMKDSAREDLKRLVYGFDALLMMGDSSAATHSVTHASY